MRTDYVFAHTVNEEARNKYKVNAKSIVIFTAEKFQSPYENKYKVLQKVRLKRHLTAHSQIERTWTI